MVKATEAETRPLVGGIRRKPRGFDPDYDEMPPPKGALTPHHLSGGDSVSGSILSNSHRHRAANNNNNNTNTHHQPPLMYADDGYYSSDDGNPYDQSSKVDRRSCSQRCISSVAGCVSYCSRPPISTSKSAAGSSGNKLLNIDYYEDTFNDDPWECTFGTSEYDGTWINCTDQVGNIMCVMVWVLIIYSIVTISLLSQQTETISRPIAMAYMTICALALSCHAKTMLSDPGGIPTQAIPRPELFAKGITTHAMCSHCQTYKPPNAHHCRICNRCISRMDHHCPWMNNCVGAGNFKHFILFLCYTWTGCAFALIIFATNYFFCNSDECVFPLVLVQLVRFMTLLCIATLLFVSSMLMNVTYGIMTGIGTIDRLKKKASGEVEASDEEPLPLQDIFGIEGFWTWFLPIDPVYEDFDRVLGYSIPARLKRERQMFGPNVAPSTGVSGSIASMGSETAASFTEIPYPTQQPRAAASNGHNGHATAGNGNQYRSHNYNNLGPPSSVATSSAWSGV